MRTGQGGSAVTWTSPTSAWRVHFSGGRRNSWILGTAWRTAAYPTTFHIVLSEYQLNSAAAVHLQRCKMVHASSNLGFLISGRIRRWPKADYGRLRIRVDFSS